MGRSGVFAMAATVPIHRVEFGSFLSGHSSETGDAFAARTLNDAGHHRGGVPSVRQTDRTAAGADPSGRRVRDEAASPLRPMSVGAINNRRAIHH